MYIYKYIESGQCFECQRRKSALKGAWKRYCSPSYYYVRPTNQTTDRQTGHREVSLYNNETQYTLCKHMYLKANRGKEIYLIKSLIVILQCFPQSYA